MTLLLLPGSRVFPLCQTSVHLKRLKMERQRRLHLLIRLVLCFSEETYVFDESGLDVFVVHKLTEDVKLLLQKLVGEIHLTEE